MLLTKQSLKKSKWNKNKYLETNDNKNTVTQNGWDAAELILRSRFIGRQSYPQVTRKSSNRRVSFGS